MCVLCYFLLRLAVYETPNTEYPPPPKIRTLGFETVKLFQVLDIADLNSHFCMCISNLRSYCLIEEWKRSKSDDDDDDDDEYSISKCIKWRMGKYLGIRQAFNVQTWPTHMPLKYSLICDE
jgi:hypothetical protein